MNIFERASRQGLRFQNTGRPAGVFSTEDLWLLSLEQLDALFRYYTKLRSSQTEGLLQKKSVDDQTTDLRLEIVKHIFESKLADQDRAEKAAETRRRNERIREIMAEKQDGALKDKSIEELQKLLDESEAAVTASVA